MSSRYFWIQCVLFMSLGVLSLYSTLAGVCAAILGILHVLMYVEERDRSDRLRAYITNMDRSLVDCECGNGEIEFQYEDGTKEVIRCPACGGTGARKDEIAAINQLRENEE